MTTIHKSIVSDADIQRKITNVKEKIIDYKTNVFSRENSVNIIFEFEDTSSKSFKVNTVKTYENEDILNVAMDILNEKYIEFTNLKIVIDKNAFFKGVSFEWENYNG